MPALLIADVAVNDADRYADYRTANPDVVNRYGGRYVAIGGDAKALEGDWRPSRVIVIEFPSMAALDAFYDSEEYAKLRPIRQASADSRLLAIETLPEPRARP